MSSGNIPDPCDIINWGCLDATCDGVDGLDLGINMLQAKSSDMAVLERRKASFLTHPYPAVKHAEELYNSGYYFSGRIHLIGCSSCLFRKFINLFGFSSYFFNGRIHLIGCCTYLFSE